MITVSCINNFYQVSNQKQLTIITSYVPNKTWKQEYLFLDIDRAVVDLTNATFRMQVRTNIDSETILAETSTTNGKITTETITANYDGVEITGEGIKIVLDSIDTLAIYNACGSAVGDLEITFPDGTIRDRVLEFIFEPSYTVTRDFL